MKHRRSTEVLVAFQGITDAAESFVNHSPRSKRLEPERQALLDAIRRAQLVLSLSRLPRSSSASSPSVPSLTDFRGRRHELKDSSPKRRKGER